MSEALVAVVSDIFSLANVPGGNVAGFALKQLFTKRLNAARESLLSELARGNIRVSEADIEESVAIIYRFLRAAQEGAARVNLRLLSQVIAKQAWNGTLKADDFLYYADLLTPLRRDEIVLLGSLYRNWGDPSRAAQEMGQRISGTLDTVKEELIPAVFQSEEDFQAILGSLSRTGLVSSVTAWDGMLYKPTALLERLVSMVDFEAAAG